MLKLNFRAVMVGILIGVMSATVYVTLRKRFGWRGWI